MIDVHAHLDDARFRSDLQELLEQLRAAGYVAVSLSVQQENPALHLYERLGFEPVRVTDGEIVMRCAL